MADALAEPVVLDATVLSNFASSGTVDWLVELLENPVVVPAVRNELDRGRDMGHEFLTCALDSIGIEIPVLKMVGVSTPLDRDEVRERLDAGEAASLLATVERDGTLATDDLAARQFADANSVPVTGSVGLLVVGVERDALDAATADEWLRIWRTARNYHAPVDSVEAALDGE